MSNTTLTQQKTPQKGKEQEYTFDVSRKQFGKNAWYEITVLVLPADTHIARQLWEQGDVPQVSSNFVSYLS